MIPYQKIYMTGKEESYMADALKRGHVGGDGYYTGLVENFIRNRFKACKVYMTTSATHALELSMLLIDIKPGDEAIMPSFTFASTANAVVLRGGRPVFAEIDENTLNIDPRDVERRITKNTKAIIPVHYAGVGCDMEYIMKLSKEYGLYVVEDAAQAVNAERGGKYLGTVGHMGCYSFHGTKNYTCGEGGALLINVEDSALMERADCIRQKGTDRSRFLRGEVGSYSWVDIGSSYSLSEVLAAMLYAQLEHVEEITEERRLVHKYYMSILKEYEDRGLLKVMGIPEDCRSNYHIFYILLNNEESRNYVMSRLKERGISALTHFVPLHSSLMGQKLGYRQGDLKVTEKASRCILRLPMYAGMAQEDMHYVGETLTGILEEL